MHILWPVTGNCPSWIRGRDRMAVELFMTNLNERMLPDVRIEPATVCIPGGRASYRATTPDFLILWFRNTFTDEFFPSHFSHELELYETCAISWRLYPNHSIRSKCCIEKSLNMRVIFGNRFYHMSHSMTKPTIWHVRPALRNVNRFNDSLSQSKLFWYIF